MGQGSQDNPSSLIIPLIIRKPLSGSFVLIRCRVTIIIAHSSLSSRAYTLYFCGNWSHFVDNGLMSFWLKHATFIYYSLKEEFLNFEIWVSLPTRTDRSSEQELAITLDTLVIHLHVKGWEINPKKIWKASSSVKFLGVPWWGVCQDIPSKVKNNLFPLAPFTSKKCSTTLSGPL